MGLGRISGSGLPQSIGARLDRGKHLATGPAIARINALSRSDFLDMFGALYPQAWVVELAEAARPYRYEADMVVALRRAVDRADDARKRELLHDYPSLADMELTDAIRKIHGMARLHLADAMARLAARDAEAGSAG